MPLRCVSVLLLLLLTSTCAWGSVLVFNFGFEQANKMREIAKSHYAIAIAGAKPVAISGDNIYEWAFNLAINGGVNDASLYYYELDPRFLAYKNELPDVVAIKKASGEWEMHPDFYGSPVSIEVAANMGNASSINNTAPLIWTRGYDSATYKWSEDSPFLGEGGYVVSVFARPAFLKSGQSAFLKFGTEEVTANIHESLPKEVNIASPVFNESNYKEISFEEVKERVERKKKYERMIEKFKHNQVSYLIRLLVILYILKCIIVFCVTSDLDVKERQINRGVLAVFIFILVVVMLTPTVGGI